MYERIVVALDGSQLAEQILPYIEKLAGAFQPTVTLVRAHEPPGSAMAGVAAALLPEHGPLADPRGATATSGEVDAYLRRVEARLSAAGVVTTSVRIDRPAPESILTVARRRHATLIAMTTHGRGGLSRFVFGSVAEAVLRAAHCPVLLLPVATEGRRAVGAPSAQERELMLRGGAARPPDDRRSGPWQHSAVPRGGMAVEDLQWVPVSVSHPCPVCGSTYGCSVSADSSHVCCRNVPSQHRVEGGGWLHELHGAAHPLAISGAAPDLARRNDDAR